MNPVKFGKYTLLEKITTGGMAEVFRGVAVGPGGFARIVAIKKILPCFADSPEFLRMFQDEASIAARLNHANIAQVYDFDIVDGVPYLAMEYVEGKDVRSILKTCAQRDIRLPWPLAVFIALEVAKGLYYVHSRRESSRPLNIVHRDVSPQNIMVSRSGEVKLVDFGIARAMKRQAVTFAGTVKGKYAYMSPEQVSGQPVDHRTDIFSLGTVLWEMLTLRRLFAGESEGETIARLLRTKVQPCHLVNPEVPARLSPIVMTALARDRSQRYPTMLAFHEALSRVLFDSGAYPDIEGISRFVHDLFPEEMERLAQGEHLSFEVPGPIEAPLPGAPRVTVGEPGTEGEPGAEREPGTEGEPGLNDATVASRPRSARGGLDEGGRADAGSLGDTGSRASNGGGAEDGEAEDGGRAEETDRADELEFAEEGGRLDEDNGPDLGECSEHADTVEDNQPGTATRPAAIRRRAGRTGTRRLVQASVGLLLLGVLAVVGLTFGKQLLSRLGGGGEPDRVALDASGDAVMPGAPGGDPRTGAGRESPQSADSNGPGSPLAQSAIPVPSHGDAATPMPGGTASRVSDGTATPRPGGTGSLGADGIARAMSSGMAPPASEGTGLQLPDGAKAGDGKDPGTSSKATGERVEALPSGVPEDAGTGDAAGGKSGVVDPGPAVIAGTESGSAPAGTIEGGGTAGEAPLADRLAVQTGPVVARRTFKLDVRTEPPDARIWVGPVPYKSGTIEIDGVAGESVTLKLTRSGYAPEEHPVILADGFSRTFRMSRPAKLRLHVKPPRCEVFVEGKRLPGGKDGWFIYSGRQGDAVTVEVSAKGRKSETRVVPLETSDEKITFELQLEPVPEPSPEAGGADRKSPEGEGRPAPGFISVNAEPYAAVLVDGKTWGDTPVDRREIAAGNHSVVLRYLELEHTCNVTVEPGAVARCSHRFPIESIVEDHHPGED